uniref:MD-2-related lipid-recognition domain-containing protein n=1 Tax=Meloidogyne enterolobii TaxID=390850 RepID=A0A6V7XXY8_MELEN|nr:unnamed protein product [Meloidogyne enterolobii]
MYYLKINLIYFFILYNLIEGNHNNSFFNPIIYKNCKSNFEIISVGITECDKSERCEFKRGKEYSLQIGFKPDKKVDNLKTLVWAHLGDAHGALTRFHVDNEDACIESNITCPLMANKIYWYKQTVLLLQEYPIVDLQVNWLLINPDAEKNDKGLPINRDVCIKFLAKVKE